MGPGDPTHKQVVVAPALTSTIQRDFVGGQQTKAAFNPETQKNTLRVGEQLSQDY